MIRAGDFLGVMVFNGGKRLWMIAPAGVEGRIVAINGRIDYEMLADPPAQFVLRLT